MRLVLPAFVCSVGSRVVAMDASLLGNRCSFIASPNKAPFGLPTCLGVAVRYCPALPLQLAAGESRAVMPLGRGQCWATGIGRLRARCQLDRARSWESSGPRTIGVTYLRRGDARNEKAPRGEPGGGFRNSGRVQPSASTAVATGYCQAVAAGIRLRVEARQPKQAVRPSTAIVAEPTQEANRGFPPTKNACEYSN